jgi:hypothetical protein
LNDDNAIDWHTDFTSVYSAHNPISSLTFERGSVLRIRLRDKQFKANKPTGIFWQFPGDAVVMWGTFQHDFEHEIPPKSMWADLAQQRRDDVNYFRVLSPDERDDLNQTLHILNAPGYSDLRYNFTVRFVEKHLDYCTTRTPPELTKTVKELNVPRSPDSSIPPPKISETSQSSKDTTQSSMTIKRFRMHSSSHAASEQEFPKPKEEHKAAASPRSDVSDVVDMEVTSSGQQLPNLCNSNNMEAIRVLQQLLNGSNLLRLARVLPLVVEDVSLIKLYCQEQERYLNLVRSYDNPLCKEETEQIFDIQNRQALIVAHSLARRKVMCAP